VEAKNLTLNVIMMVVRDEDQKLLRQLINNLGKLLGTSGEALRYHR
jgi:hypothetical protein